MTLLEGRSFLSITGIDGGSRPLLRRNALLLGEAISPSVGISLIAELVAERAVTGDQPIGSLFRGCAANQKQENEVAHG